MAKISLNKLGLKINSDEIVIEINGENIFIKQYVSIENKTAVIEKIVNACISNSTNFYNPIEVEVRKAIAIIEMYTNIGLTEKQKEEITKTYDLFISTKAYNKIIDSIPKTELDVVDSLLYTSLENVYGYNNSIAGILAAMHEEYQDLSFDAERIKNDLAENSKELIALQDIITNK